MANIVIKVKFKFREWVVGVAACFSLGMGAFHAQPNVAFYTKQEPQAGLSA